MKLVRIRLRNFRCFKDEISIEFDNLTALIGKNDAGKSSIFEALDIFFNEAKIDPEDASCIGDKEDVRIICEFDDLPSSIVVDVDYKTTLENEYLLNENNHLEINKVYNCSLVKPKLVVFARAIHPTVKNYSDLLTLKRTELQARASNLGVDVSQVDNRINAQLRRAIWNSSGNLLLSSSQIPLDKEGAKQIWDQIKKELPIYSVFKSDRPSTDQDEEAQDPMKIAVKEAIKVKENELNEISEYVRNKVKLIADDTVNKIREMDPKLASQFSPQFSPPNWANVFKISLTGDDEIPINKRGSGVRRLILLNFFRAKAEQIAKERESSNIIYAVEEPETCQHPNTQRMLIQAFSDLAEQPGCQVIISTHTPTLGRLLPVDSLRYLEVQGDKSRVIHSKNNYTYNSVAKALGVLPDHDVKLFIGIEGPNDINFLKIISRILKQAGEQVPDLIDLEEKGHIIFIPEGGSNLLLWTSRLKGLNRPEFHIFDYNAVPPNKSTNQQAVDEINRREGCAAVLTGKLELENYLHPDAIKAVRSEVEISFGDYDDVPELVAKSVHESSESDKEWPELDEKAKAKKISSAKYWLNTKAVEAMTPTLLSERDPNKDIRDWLMRMNELLKQTV